MTGWPLACLLAAAFAQEAPAPAGAPVDTPEERLAEEMTRRLRDDPSARQALADRILASSLADEAARESPAQVSDWLEAHPDDAGHLAAGFAEDDRAGTRRFEDSLHTRIRRYFALNPGRSKGILGVLEAAGAQSRKVATLDQKLSDEEQQEMLRRLFEGKGAENTGTLKERASSAASPVSPAYNFYDRLSAANLSGYSPQVLALQSLLNRERAPGAPKIVETGKLDLPTLLAPYYALRHDYALAERALADAPPDARSRRWLADAAAALDSFRREARPLKDVSRITAASLKTLGRRQKDAARWISAASIQAEAERLGARGRPGEDGAPARALAACDEAAAEMLSGTDYLRRWAEAEGKLAECASLRAALARAAKAKAEELPPEPTPKPRWRAYWERLLRWLYKL